MIDIENELITGFHNYLNAIQDDFIRTSKLKITTVFVDKTYTSPVIFFQEIDNHSYEKTATENTQENHAQITYEVNVYNNSPRGTTGAKDTTRWLMNLVDEYMLSKGFVRIMASFIPNVSTNIHRMVARYQAVVSKDKTIYRR